MDRNPLSLFEFVINLVYRTFTWSATIHLSRTAVVVRRTYLVGDAAHRVAIVADDWCGDSGNVTLLVLYPSPPCLNIKSNRDSFFFSGTGPDTALSLSSSSRSDTAWSGASDGGGVLGSAAIDSVLCFTRCILFNVMSVSTEQFDERLPMCPVVPRRFRNAHHTVRSFSFIVGISNSFIAPRHGKSSPPSAIFTVSFLENIANHYT